MKLIRKLFSENTTVLTLQGKASPSLTDGQHSWPLFELMKQPESEWPVGLWDIRLGLELHQVLCIPSMPGLNKSDYPAYWQGIFQQSFPDQNWVLSPTQCDGDRPVLVSALPQPIADALEPFKTRIRWCRPVWAPLFTEIEHCMNWVQRSSLLSWIGWEGSRVIWLQRHQDLNRGWKKAVIRVVPEAVEERETWLRAMLTSEYPEGVECPAVLSMEMGPHNALLRADELTISVREQQGWMMYTPDVLKRRA